MLSEIKNLKGKIEKEKCLRKQLQKRLFECEKQNQYLLGRSSAGIFEFDLNTGRLTAVDEVLCQLTGYRKDELLKTDILSLLTEESQILFIGHMEMIKAGLSISEKTELKFRTKCGVTSWVEFYARLKYEARKIAGVTGIVNDIDKRKRAELALTASEEKYRTILEGIGEGYFEVDLAGYLTFFNDAVCRSLGYKREEMIGGNSRVYTTPEGVRKLDAVFNEVYRTGIPGVISDYEYVCKDGTLKYMELSIYLMQDPERQKAVGFRGFARDVAARRSAEKRRRVLEKKLQRSQKLESIGTLAGGIAHDFNNLMMSILGSVSLMQCDLSPEHPHGQRLENITEQVQQGARLTSQLLSYVQKGRYAPKQFDLNNIITDTTDAFGRVHKAISLELMLTRELLFIEADQAQIEQVLLNLYLNAADAMPDGGKLMVRTDYTDHSFITAKTFSPKPGHYVCLHVTDEGEGMSREVMAHIFDPFFTTKEMGQGTGLGLASVYGIVKFHQGYIDVTSSPGKGSTFSIYLPALATKAEQLGRYLKQKQVEGRTILIIDDETTVLDINAEMLERLGYRVFKAGGGRSALEVFRKSDARIDLVILGMTMPDLSGSQTFDELKKIDSTTRVLLSSGYSLSTEARKIMDRGCSGFIQKPFGIQQLAHKIEAIFKGHEKK